MAKVVGWVEMLAADQRGAPGRRRLAAFGVDYAFIAAYLGVLVLLGVLGRAAGLLPSRVTTPSGRIIGQLAAIAVVTVPVTLWFAWWEAAPRGATPGQAPARPACQPPGWWCAVLAALAAALARKDRGAVGVGSHRSVEPAWPGRVPRRR